MADPVSIRRYRAWEEARELFKEVWGHEPGEGRRRAQRRRCIAIGGNGQRCLFSSRPGKRTCGKHPDWEDTPPA